MKLLSTLTLVNLTLIFASCGGGNTSKPADVSATVGGTGPQVSNTAPPPPAPPTPKANETVYVAHIVDKATGNPIGGAKCTLLRNMPEPEYMRIPARRDVISDYVTPLHGQFHGTAEADGKMKWILVAGRGFDPFITDAGIANGGQTHEMTIRAEIIPTVKFIVRAPNGDRAAEAICTMKPHEDEAAVRKSSANIGTTERADDFGEAVFNRKYGTYRLIFTDFKGRYRHYELFEWNAAAAGKKKIEIQLPAKSMTEAPWGK